MRIGITGGEGFIGSYLKNKIEDPILFEGFLDDMDRVKEFVNDVDRIYHLAGLNREKPGEILKNNVSATGLLALAIVGSDTPKEVVFASSLQVETNPKSEYGLTKSIEEEIIKKCPRWCIYRIPNVYGPGGRPFYNSVVATFTYQVAKGETVTINDPTAKKEFIFIDDLVESLIHPRFNEYVKPAGEVISIGQVHEFLTSRYGEHEKLKRCLDFYTEG